MLQGLSFGTCSKARDLQGLAFSKAQLEACSTAHVPRPGPLNIFQRQGLGTCCKALALEHVKPGAHRYGTETAGGTEAAESGTETKLLILVPRLLSVVPKLLILPTGLMILG